MVSELTVGLVLCAASLQGFAPHGLAVERLQNPVGVDASKPRLSWQAPDGLARQLAYEIEADGVSRGKVEGDAQIDVPWPGEALATGSRHSWRVRLWDADGRATEWSEPSSFVMGVTDPADWKAKWIGPNAATRPDIELGNAKWISAPDGRYSTTLVLDEVPKILEIVFFSRTRYQMFVNGMKSGWSYTGHFLDLRYPRMANLAPELKSGTNVVEIVAPNEGDAVPSALIAAFRENLVRTFGETGAGWSPANVLGGLREVEWGRGCVLREELASPAFRKRFSVGRDVARATLFITGVGYYEASLNGARIGDKVLDPSPTDYRKRVLYSTYILDGLVRKGENELSVLLGHGFYDGRVRDEWNFDMAPWRDFPRMIAQLEIVYADGSKETVVSDGSWRQVKSPVGWDDIHEGEVVGGSHGREPKFPPDGFAAEEVPGPGGVLTCAAQPPTRVVRELKPVAVYPVPDEQGAFLVEFPANVTGWARLRFRRLSKGDVVTVRYDERADGGKRPAADSSGGGVGAAKSVGGVETRRIDCHFRGSMSHAVCRVNSGFQIDRFISSGAPEETYEPRFTYNGFRYVYVRGLKSPLKAEDAVQCFVSTDFPETGAFSSSDKILDRLVSAAAQSYRCNFTQGFPTDCPHREKNGWTDDASMASAFGMIRFDNDAAYAKWVQDIVDAQDSKGDLPGIVPTSGWGYLWGNGPMSDSALTVVPWNLYRYRADSATLEKAYPAVVKYLAYTETKADKDGLVSHGLGDWNPVDWNVAPSVRFVASCFHMQATRIAGEMAAVLGRAEESAAYSRRADGMRSAMRRVFMRPDGRFDDGRQTAQACAIEFGLCERDELCAVGERLVEAVHANGDHTETGLVGSKTLYRALTKIGRADLALKVLLQPEAPSPAAWVVQGSDTLWEDYRDGLSRNHIMFGDFAAWAYEGLAGIRPTAPGYRSFEVDPAYGCGLRNLSASIMSPYGRISVDWEKDRFLSVTVPPCTTARVKLPDGRIEALVPGRVTFPFRSGAGSPYGACAHLTYGEPAGRTCAMMRQAGIGWVRCDFDWHAVERKKGEWDFSAFDRVVSESEAEGVQILPILGHAPPWAGRNGVDLDAWGEYVRRVVTRYGMRLPVVEVWNEENADGFWNVSNPTNYISVLRRTYETAKKVDPGVMVAFGGTAGVPFGFIEEVYRLGGAKWFDIMNIHPYSYPRRPEGTLDARLEELRALMWRHGDAEKPIWITEIGWPTHRPRFFSEDGLLLAGLKAARPAAGAWRMLYVPAYRDEEGEEDELVCGHLRDILPEGSRVEVCHASGLPARLAKGDVDGIVYPPLSEAYAADSADAVYGFVKSGGVLVEFGGVPMLYAFRTGADGAWRADGNAATWRDRQRLRIAETAWWKDSRYPESIPVRPAAAAAGLRVPASGFNGQRFFLGSLLKPGDEFLPLLSASTNGVEAVAAAVYRFNSDMKGAVVVSGLLGNHGTTSEGRQAKMMARALGIAFAEGVENFFWYEFRQLDLDQHDPESYFGIVRDNFSPKPAYGAYMTFIDARPAGSLRKKAVWRSEDGKIYFPQWTRPDKSAAGMIWAQGAGKTLDVAFSSDKIVFLDVVGARVRPDRSGNVYTLQVSDSPIYFFGGEMLSFRQNTKE